jgi:Calx-beta domain
MKKINNHWRLLVQLFVFGLVAVTLLNCKEQQIVFEGGSFARFSDTLLTYKESYNKVIKVKVHNAGPILEESVVLNYTVGGTAREGKDYRFIGTKGTVTIPAKQSFGEIQIQLINNANNILDESSVDFTLTTAAPSEKIKVGLGKVGVTTKLIIKDACIYEGTYTGLRLVTATTGYQVPNIDVSSVNCKTYTVSNWNIGLFDFEAITPTINFIDNGNNTLTIPPQKMADLSAPRDTITGNGNYNPANKRITLNLKLKTVSAKTKKDTIVTIPLTYIPQ